MASPIILRIETAGGTSTDVALECPTELGRQRENEPAPFGLAPPTGDQPARLIVAGRAENTVPRSYLLLEPLPDGRVRASNRSPIPFPRADGAPPIPPNSTAELLPPFSLSLPPRTIRVLAPDSTNDPGLHSLSDQTLGPAGLQEASRRWKGMAALPAALAGQMEGWLKAAMGVLQSAVGSADFIPRAAEALVQIVGLRAGRVLLLDGGQWTTAACDPPSDNPDWRPSSHVLAHVREQHKTFWQTPAQQPGGLDTPSLSPQFRVVAAPLLDGEGNVIGALYGERPAGAREAGNPRLEALLVDLLASGVATGLARQEQEQKTAEEQVRFAQFFTPNLAERLRRDPNMLQGREAEVTVLFTDVRNFSKFSEMLGPQKTIAWMNEVMNALSRAVLEHEGVLVDYIGDELMAMWGAPEKQPDQRTRAIRAGLAMIAALPALNAKWQPILGEPMNIGVGINTGLAQVGNTGSSFKFKYGPLGNTVNLASRVQGLTKYLKCRLLVSAATCKELNDHLLARRVVRTRVVNIKEPVDLFEVETYTAERQTFFRDSETALRELEALQFAEAAGRSGALLMSHRGDGPLLLTLSRATTQLVQGGTFDPVWEPPGK